MLDVQLNVPTTRTADPHASDALRQKVRAFVTSNFYVANERLLADDASLLDSGVIDSTGVLEVISFLESEFLVQVADEDIVPENLDSITRIAAFVDRKRG